MQPRLLWASKGCRSSLGVRCRGEREGTGREPGSSATAQALPWGHSIPSSPPLRRDSTHEGTEEL